MDFLKALPVVLQGLAGDQKHDKDTAKSLAQLGISPPSRESLMSLEVPQPKSEPKSGPKSNSLGSIL